MSLLQGSKPLAGTFADAPAVKEKDYLPSLVSTVGCVTLPPTYFRILPKEYSDARGPKVKSTSVLLEQYCEDFLMIQITPISVPLWLPTTYQEETPYGLNVCNPPSNSHVEILIPKVMVLGGGASS